MSKGSGRRPVDEKAFQDNWDKIFSKPVRSGNGSRGSGMTKSAKETSEAMIEDLILNRHKYTKEEYQKKYRELLLKVTDNENLPDIRHPQPTREDPVSGC